MSTEGFPRSPDALISELFGVANMPAETKICRTCREDKQLYEFNGSSKSKDGLAPSCRACVNKGRRERARKQGASGGKRKSMLTATRTGDVNTAREYLASFCADTVGDAATFFLEHVVRDYRTVKKTPGHVESVHLLVEYGAKVQPYLVGEAARGGNRELIEALLECGAERTLHVAAALGDVAAVQRALASSPERAAEADPPIHMEFGTHSVVRGNATALHYAAWSSLGLCDDAVAECLASIASLLLDAGAPLDAIDREGNAPMQYAVQCGGNPKLVRVLLEHGATFDGAAFAGVLRQLQRSGAGQAEIADMVWESGAVDQDAVRREGVHGHARQAISKIVLWLLDRGTDVNQRDAGGRTALHWVGERQAIAKMARILLERGAELEPIDDAGKTPLDLAVENERVEVEEFLRSRGAKKRRRGSP